MHRAFRLTVATEDADAFLSACHQVAWGAEDTGDRITTEDGVDAEIVLSVVPMRADVRGGEKLATPLSA